MNTMQYRQEGRGVRASLFSGLLGITLLTPASFFMLALLVRVVFGARSLYYWMAPSFLQSPFDLFALHKAQLIIGCLILALFFNILAVVQFDLQRGKRGLEVVLGYRRNWLNTAVVLQSTLLLVILSVYTLVQHIRY